MATPSSTSLASHPSGDTPGQEQTLEIGWQQGAATTRPKMSASVMEQFIDVQNSVGTRGKKKQYNGKKLGPFCVDSTGTYWLSDGLWFAGRLQQLIIVIEG